MQARIGITTLLVTLALVAATPPAGAQVGYQPPVDECTNPDGSIVLNPGPIPLACGPYQICVLWTLEQECVSSVDWQPASCGWTYEERESEGFLDAQDVWSETLWNDWLPCVLDDYNLWFWTQFLGL